MVVDILLPSDSKAPNGAGVVPQQQSGGNVRGAASLQSEPVIQIKAAKQGDFKEKLKEDRKRCDTNGLAITKDGSILMTDYQNDKVKLFSPDMKYLSSVSFPAHTWHIAMISDREAATTTTNNSLVLLDISASQLRIRTTTKVPYYIRGITKYKNKLVISSTGLIPSVKLIDLAGKVYWSVSSDQLEQSLFNDPWHLTSMMKKDHPLW